MYGTACLLPSLQTFTRTLNAEDWRRFQRYARRVRNLSYFRDRTDMKSPYLGGRVLDEVARSRTTLNILPNLSSLEWHSDETRHAVVFMGQNVRRFSVFLHKSQHYPLSDFFKDISARMPSLTHLDLAFEFSVRDIEADLIGLISELPQLEKLTLPSYCFTSKITEALSLLPCLETLQFEFYDRQGKGDPADIIIFAPRLHEGAFPALVDLNLSAHLSDITHFITSPYAPSHLTSLYIHLPSVVSPSTVNEYITAVAENCKLLQKLYIDLFIPPVPEGHFPHPAQRHAQSLTWADLRPILLCTHLQVLEVTWPSPFHLTQDDVEELASSWPSLQILQLNCLSNPILSLDQPTLTLRALIPFAAHCPELEELGLDVDTNAALLTDDVSAPPPKPFRKLARLHFGLSSLVEPGPTALFLSQLCPLGCEIWPGPRVPDGFDFHYPPWLSELLDLWAEVGRVLPLLVRLRMQERARRRELEREAEDLRIRCKVLEEYGRLPEGAMNADGSCLVL